MKPIAYLKGDATAPQGEGPKIICHIVNDVGAWGAGFVLALSRRWKKPEDEYHGLSDCGALRLGAVQFIEVEPGLSVANMVAQHGTSHQNGPPIRYAALSKAFEAVAYRAAMIGASCHMPRLGCGLAGGKWEVVEAIIEEHVSRVGIAAYVYDLP